MKIIGETMSKLNPSEHDLEQYLINQCKKRDILTFKFTSPSQNGVPDRIIIGNGHVVFCELKAPNKHARLLQLHVFKKMSTHGAIIYHDVDSYTSIDTLLTDIERSHLCPTI